MASDMDDAARAFYEVSKRLKAAEKGVRSEFHKAIREAAKPLLPAVQRQAAVRFPQRGGLARRMSRKTGYATVARTGAATAGVSVVRRKTDPRMDSQGRIVHPVPGPGGEPLTNSSGRRLAVVQFHPDAVGFFSDTIESRAGAVRAEMVQRMIRYVEDNLAGDLGG